MLESGFDFHEIEILLEGVSVLRIPKDKARGRRVFVTEKIDHGRPNEGDRVTVNIDGRELFNGQLVKD
jgi:hypothetical protein